MKGELRRAGVSAKVILAKLEPEDELRQFFAAFPSSLPAGLQLS